jgi:hypothetical protein
VPELGPFPILMQSPSGNVFKIYRDVEAGALLSMGWQFVDAMPNGNG